MAIVFYFALFGILWVVYVLVSDISGWVSGNRSVRTAECNSIPVVGLRNEWFQATRASLRQLTHGVTTLMDGYRQVRT